MKGKFLNNLRNTVKDFFHLLSEFGKLKKQKQEMKIVLLDDQLQELTKRHEQNISSIFP